MWLWLLKPQAEAICSIGSMPDNIDLGFGRSAAIWSNAQDRMSYQRPNGHKFSLYLRGGAGTRRLDGSPAARGRPGVLCIMPQEH
ncbi:AraC family transcriptional regulator, partial [Rhizobium ruizarguesonis]